MRTGALPSNPTDYADILYVPGQPATTYGGVNFGSPAVLDGISGALDNSFATGAGTTGSGSTIFDVTEDSTRRIYGAGTFLTFRGQPAPQAFRLLHDGTFDPSFVLGSGFDSATYLAVPVNDGSGRIYYFGTFTTYQGQPAGRIARLKEDGSMDQ